MKQEELLKTLILSLKEMDTLHQEYQDNDIHYVVDYQKDNNNLDITIQLIEDKDKEEFEEWLKKVDDNLFTEVLDELQKKDGIGNLNEMYNSKNYRTVISKVKNKTQEIAARKIQELQKLLN